MDDSSPSGFVTVEILGRRYTVRGDLDTGEVSRVAAYVQEKMRRVEQQSPRRDIVDVAVTVALNIADDYFRAAAGRHDRERAIRNRTLEIETMLDRAVEGAPDPPD